MSGELVGVSDQDANLGRATHGTGWDSLAEERSGERTTSWDDLKNVEMANADRTNNIRTTVESVNELRRDAMVKKYGKMPTLEQLAGDLQDAKQPIGEIHNDEAMLEYLGTVKMLSEGFQKEKGDEFRDYRIDNFAKNALGKLKPFYGEEMIEDQGNTYLENSHELGMADAVIANLAQVQQSTSELTKKTNEKMVLEIKIHDLEDNLGKMGVFDRLFSTDRTTLKTLREKEDRIEQTIGMMNRVVEADKSSLRAVLERAYGEDQDKDEQTGDVFESELYQKFTQGERGERVERAIDLYRKVHR